MIIAELHSPPRPLQLWSRVMLRLLAHLRAVGRAVGEGRYLSLLLRRQTGAGTSLLSDQSWRGGFGSFT